jgi:RNA polymerase sigma-70 factor, ECF subfamily
VAPASVAVERIRRQVQDNPIVPGFTGGLGVSLTERSDAELVSSVLSGNVTAFATIMSRNNRRLYRVARAILRNDADTEDALQEAYLRAFTKLAGFNGRASLTTWLTSIVINESLGRLRSGRTSQALADAVGPTMAEDDSARFKPAKTLDPECQAALGETRQMIEHAIDRLPAEFRQVFMLRTLEQLSVEETADHLGIPKATVKTRCHRANSLLRKVLGGDFGPLLADGFPFAGERCKRLTGQVLELLTLIPLRAATQPHPDGSLSRGSVPAHRLVELNQAPHMAQVTTFSAPPQPPQCASARENSSVVASAVAAC